ncbi:MAG: phosphate/phosphite/phosphonate ABC transporter substrate-binding protein [Chloroflexi bacterium]|nr:phosphate/phosphite/phosphonate ABC transporter substrate-binding protein [Chloroflexota bacterium]
MNRIVFFLLFLLTACSAGLQPAASIKLNDLQPLPTPALEVVPLRVAVAAVISPKGTVESYAPLLDYLGQKLNRPVELVQRRTYLEVNDLIERGEVDLAFVCTSAYIVGYDDFGMELLTAPQVKGETIYHADLIVPVNSPASDMADLKGTVFAFTDPISLTGRAYPTALVQQLGSTPETFFSRTFFTYSHDEAIYAVANGLADGASVDSLVFEYALSRDPSLSQKVKVIHQSPPFGIPPVVVNPNLRPQVKADLQALLLEMDNDPAGQTALSGIGIERFVTIDDNAYASARLLIQEVPLPALP